MLTEALLEETLVEGPKGKDVDGLSLTCGVCDHCVECPGHDTPGNRQVLVDRLNSECPEGRCHRFLILLGQG